MRLVRLYSNQPLVFAPVEFGDGISAVVAEIRLPENRDLDTHNLGKTTVGSLIDFCLLKGKHPEFFLFKHEKVFAPFAFYLELRLREGSYLTIRRAVVPGSKVDFLRSAASVRNAGLRADGEWDHRGVAFDRAKALLDGMLHLDVLKPWGFRKLAGYLVRTQQDYQDVFQLGKFSGKHQDWKPFVAHLLGAQTSTVRDLYEKRAERDQAQSDLQVLLREWGTDETDPSLLDGLIAARRREVASKEATLEGLNFGSEDQQEVADLVDHLDDRIAALNEELYRLRQLHKRIDDSLEQRQVAFRPDAAAKLFKEAGVVFEGQLKKDFKQLIAFNRAITDERHEALVEQRSQAADAIEETGRKLSALNAERALSLSFIRETDTLEKYKATSRRLSALQADLAVLEQRREAVGRLSELRRQARTLRHEFDELQTVVEDEFETLSGDDTSRFGTIRRYFGDIIAAVIDEQAVLSMTLNKEGGVEFRAELMGSKGLATSADKGTSYRKLLCIAFDLALLRTYLDVPFPRFVYLDGAFEQLEPRKRENLIQVLRDYAEVGVQPVVSLLDSDLPAPLGTSSRTLLADEVVLTLHDEGEPGRLFKMAAW